MAQNKVSLVLTGEQVAAAIAAIAQLEAALAGLITLDAAEKKSLLHLGQKSESFARGTIRLLSQNPRLVPPSLDVVEAQADMDARDALVPVQEALRRLLSWVNDTMAALEHDIMAAALDGYAILKVAGGTEGVDELRKELGARFAKGRRKPKPESEDSTDE